MMGAVELARNGLGLGILYIIGHMVYNIFLHPLRKYPGPLSHRMTILPHAMYQFSGRLPFRVSELHKQYGPVVRIAPGELAFSSIQAWRDIYGHKKNGEEEFPKYDGIYKLVKGLPTSIINSDRQEHGLLRRQLAHGFSDRSMREQEPIIGSYVNLLISRLRDASQKSTSQNLREWYNWTTFDIIGDLSFGVEGGFGCLENAGYHPWVQVVTDTVRQNGWISSIYRLGLGKLIQLASDFKLLADDKYRAAMFDKVGERMNGAERPDFLEGLIRKKDELNLSQQHMTMNATVLVVAGSETTATLLSGATFLLTTHPEVLKKLEQEVRSAFKSDDEITLTSVGNLSYMLACLNESLRRYPPVVTGLPRLTPKGGATIDDTFVPEGTIVSVYQWAINHDERFWSEPEKFAPERWMGEAKYNNDHLEAMQSFSVGPRNCIGRNLAYAEMRLILAKIVYNFDISLADNSRDWLDDQRAFVVWDKPALNIHLKPVQH
ncbi:putative cytochrome P450 [Rosellinia necatrix]|uniref:Putative cytochrome P450 n=1 Tax=Rosellinia necatrix TaxID=77044 RepID=A0A1W2TQ55_ROSNE|nr:putative cytochrome P450 [Rosellinia necatrix]